jgi:protein-disulfide isomerase
MAIGLLFVLHKKDTDMATLSTTARLAPPVSDRDHLRGPADALVTLLEYGDYECPYCGRAYYVIHELMKLAGDDFRFAFRNFPLVEVHPHAEHAAEAAEAAGAQGKFWRMHDTLFEHQNALEDADLIRYATALRLEVKRFRQELAEHVYAGRVLEDFNSGVQSGVTGTPTFFINGLRYEGPHDVESLLAAIEYVAQEVG